MAKGLQYESTANSTRVDGVRPQENRFTEAVRGALLMTKHLVIGCAVALACIWTAPARPCFNATYKINNSAVRVLKKAEKLLRGDEPLKALKTVNRIRRLYAKSKGSNRKGAYRKGHHYVEHLDRRRRRIKALAVVRLNGHYDRKGRRLKKGHWAQLENSALFFRNGPKIYYSEALERLGENDAAYKILIGLHKVDLLHTSRGFASLARLAASIGHHDFSLSLFERCSEVAGERSSKVCLKSLTGLPTKPTPGSLLEPKVTHTKKVK